MNVPTGAPRLATESRWRTAADDRAGSATRRLRKLDNEIRLAGFRGYEGCEHLRTDRRGCPTPFMCSEKGSCIRDGIVSRG